MNAIRKATLAAAFVMAAALPASAMTVANLAHPVVATPAAFVLDQQLLRSGPTRLDRVDAETARAAAESYFDFDALITLGVVVLAGGALAAFAAATQRKASSEVDPEWRESVFRAMQADLAEFTETYRRVA